MIISSHSISEFIHHPAFPIERMKKLSKPELAAQNYSPSEGNFCRSDRE
jgi:hypothetical protein